MKKPPANQKTLRQLVADEPRKTDCNNHENYPRLYAPPRTEELQQTLASITRDNHLLLARILVSARKKNNPLPVANNCQELTKTLLQVHQLLQTAAHMAEQTAADRK